MGEGGGWLREAVGGQLRLLWLLYAQRPQGPPPRRWRGLVGYGRLDIAARFLLASLYPGGRLLSDAGLLLFLDEGGGDGVLLGLLPGCLPEEMVEEREAAEVLLAGLRGEPGCPRTGEASLRGLLHLAKRAGRRRLLLSEDGVRLERGVLRGRLLLLAGSRVDPPGWTRSLVDHVVSVGCFPYLASAVASYINLLRLLFGDEGG